MKGFFQNVRAVGVEVAILQSTVNITALRQATDTWGGLCAAFLVDRIQPGCRYISFSPQSAAY
jgi:hypothetical protein